MHWSDTAIVLSARRHGESSAIARLLSREHGVYGGVVRAAHSKANRGVLAPGNIVSATWNARLSEQLGNFKAELLEPMAALIMGDAARLAALSAACTLIESALPERHPYPRLYALFYTFLTQLKEGENWHQAYVRFELEILAESGFGLDLSQCAATGTTEDLIYVSPKSGRAVCREAGKPYKDKLLALPGFLLVQEHPLSRESGGGSGRGPYLISRARDLRKTQTDVEHKIWYHLRAHRFEGYGFRRQYPIDKYIADFVCLEKMLIIELDGGQHAEQQEYDAKRTAHMESKGYRVLRFWNNEVMENMEGVLGSIADALKAPSPTLPRDAGEGEKDILPSNNNEETLAGLRLTGYFLAHWLLEPHRRKLPAARSRLMEMMTETQKTHAAETTSA